MQTKASTRRTRLPPRSQPLVFAFFMSSMMAAIMCCVITAINSGIDSGYPLRVASTYLIAMPTAFLCVMLLRPLVLRLVALTVERA